jgi:hypothetical protein
VVVAADAGGVHLLGHGLGNRRGHAALHGVTKLRKQKIDMRCVDTIAMYLFYIFIIDFSLEMLDLIHRIYEADESFRSLNFMVHTQLYIPHIVIQICLGHADAAGPAGHYAGGEAAGDRAQAHLRRLRQPDLIGIFAMRWNVVIGGQLFSKSFLGYTTYKMALVTREGLLVAIFLTSCPLVFLWVLVKLLPPWPELPL